MPETIIMSGAPVAADICGKLKTRCEALSARGVRPCLAILRVGERAGDLSYEKGAMKRCASVGIEVRSIALPDMVSREELLSAVESLNADSSVHGVLIMRPLPRHLDEREICDTLEPFKDVDGITTGSLAAVYSGSGAGFAPCTAQAAIELLKYYGIQIAGRRATVIGRSLVIGRPVSMLLMRENATVTICHTGTADVPAITREADIVIAAAGQIKTVTAQNLSGRQAVVDVGINVDAESGKLCGDVDYEGALEHVCAISPVPGGVGAVTTSVLAEHVVQSAERIG